MADGNLANRSCQTRRRSLRGSVQRFGRSGDLPGEIDGALGHARKLDPLARELGICFLEPDMRGAARGFLGGFRKFEITRYSFFAIIVRTHTRTALRGHDARGN